MPKQDRDNRGWLLQLNVHLIHRQIQRKQSHASLCMPMNERFVLNPWLRGLKCSILCAVRLFLDLNEEKNLKFFIFHVKFGKITFRKFKSKINLSHTEHKIVTHELIIVKIPIQILWFMKKKFKFYHKSFKKNVLQWYDDSETHYDLCLFGNVDVMDHRGYVVACFSVVIS